jgi:biopolymer transport protein TolQ
VQTPPSPAAVPIQAAPDAGTVDLDIVSLVVHSSGPVFIVFWGLVLMAAGVWIIAVMKFLQLGRMRSSLHRFEKDAFNSVDASQLFGVAQRHGNAPGSRVVMALSRRGGSPKVLESVAKRAIVAESQRAASLMPTLGSIAAAAPFIGLFGTVYGILDAFLRIGREKSASLPVVAPAIGEALIATAVGLFAAIPALVFYNYLSRRIEDMISELEAASEGWVHIVADSDAAARTSGAPGAYG